MNALNLEQPTSNQLVSLPDGGFASQKSLDEHQEYLIEHDKKLKSLYEELVNKPQPWKLDLTDKDDGTTRVKSHETKQDAKDALEIFKDQCGDFLEFNLRYEA